MQRAIWGQALQRIVATSDNQQGAYWRPNVLPTLSQVLLYKFKKHATLTECIWLFWMCQDVKGCLHKGGTINHWHITVKQVSLSLCLPNNFTLSGCIAREPSKCSVNLVQFGYVTRHMLTNFDQTSQMALCRAAWVMLQAHFNSEQTKQAVKTMLAVVDSSGFAQQQEYQCRKLSSKHSAADGNSSKTHFRNQKKADIKKSYLSCEIWCFLKVTTHLLSVSPLPQC